MPGRPPVLASPRRAVLLGLLAVLAPTAALTAAPGSASAAGVAFGARIGSERAVVSLEGGREEVVLGLDLRAPASGAPAARRPGVLVPVPAEPTAQVLPEAQRQVLPALERATRAIVTQDGDDSGTTTADDAPAPREPVDDYELTRLPAGDAGALRAWLARGGFRPTAAQRAALGEEVRRGRAFVALRLRGPVDADGTALAPVRIAFSSRRLVYPVRVAAASPGPLDLQLFVLGRHRVVSTPFVTFYAGSAASLDPPLPGAVRPLLRGTYLTKLGIASDDPADATSDAFFRQGVSDRLFRASDEYPYETVDNFALGPLPRDLPGRGDDAPLADAPGGAAWLLLFPAVGLSVFLVFVVLRLRERLRRRA